MESAIDFIAKKYNGKYYYSSLINGYRKFDASRGMEYILDLKFYEMTTNQTVLKRYDCFLINIFLNYCCILPVLPNSKILFGITFDTYLVLTFERLLSDH